MLGEVHHYHAAETPQAQRSIAGERLSVAERHAGISNAPSDELAQSDHTG
jgi:hypothetical protein